jgi:GAF domain-containing protein
MNHSEPNSGLEKTVGTDQDGDERLYDAGRLDAISKLDRANLHDDDVLNAIVKEAAVRLDLPISLVSFVLDQAQVFPVNRGLTGWLAEVEGTPIEWSFCANAVRDDAPFIVEDATTNQRVKDIPLVKNEGIRCYAGIPLRLPDGSVLGTLCVIGTEPRSFSPDDMSTLRHLADRAAARLAEMAAIE